MDVPAWLRGLGLEQYAQLFRDNDIDGEILCTDRERSPGCPEYCCGCSFSPPHCVVHVYFVEWFMYADYSPSLLFAPLDRTCRCSYPVRRRSGVCLDRAV